MKAITGKAKTKKSKRLTLKDRLSRLTYLQAAKLLGPEGQQLIRRGASYDTIDIDRDVYFRGDLFRLKLRGIGERGKDIVATITTMAEAKNRLRMNCTACETVCEHIGAAVSLILEEKTALGLAAEPDERRPIETLNEQELLEQALRDRLERRKPRSFACNRPIRKSRGRITRSPARFRARRIAWRCAARGGAIRSVPVRIFARTRLAPASTLCTCCIESSGGFPSPQERSLIATARRSFTWSMARRSRFGCNCRIDRMTK